MNEIFTVSSLEKNVQGVKLTKETSGRMLKNEVYSFQVIYKYDWCAREIKVDIDSEIKKFITVREVGYVPAMTPNTWAGDDFVISKAPFLCPPQR